MRLTLDPGAAAVSYTHLPAHVQTVLGALLVQMQKITQTQGLLAVLVAVSVSNAAPGRASSMRISFFSSIGGVWGS